MAKTGLRMYIPWIMKRPLTGIELDIIESRVSHLTPSYWHKDPDNRPYARIYYVNKGLGFIRSYGRQYELTPGRLYLIPPAGDFAYGCKKDLQIWWLHFTAKLFSYVDLFDYLPYEIELVPQPISHIEASLSRLIEIHGNKSARDQLESGGILLQLLSMFFKDPEGENLPQAQNIRTRLLPALKHIEEHPDERISVETLAKIAGYEKSHFSTLFSTAFATSPAKYIMRKRIEQAQLLLQRSNDKMETLAHRLGFSDAFHFSKAFKHQTGVSPSEYRKKGETGAP